MTFSLLLSSAGVQVCGTVPGGQKHHHIHMVTALEAKGMFLMTHLCGWHVVDNKMSPFTWFHFLFKTEVFRENIKEHLDGMRLHDCDVSDVCTRQSTLENPTWYGLLSSQLFGLSDCQCKQEVSPFRLLQSDSVIREGKASVGYPTGATKGCHTYRRKSVNTQQ